MAGIINYFHGETGTVAGCRWELAGASPMYVMTLEGDPHRRFAFDSGSDIGIDPLVAPGDGVCYLRLEDATGIWLRAALQAATDISSAIERVLAHRRWIDRWAVAGNDEDRIRIAREIFEASGEPLRVTSGRAGEPGLRLVAAGWAMVEFGRDTGADDRPTSAASFFLSHASDDTLLARRIHQDLSHDAHADVWLDLARPAHEVPDTDAGIEDWLRQSVYAANGFVLLWTEHAAKSDWVRKEFGWASALAASRPGFRLIVLVLRDVPLPAELSSGGAIVIDCGDIWWSNGLNEELYAAVFGRLPRRAWLRALGPGAPVSPGQTIGYADFESHAGIVTHFDWAWSQLSGEPAIRWAIEYRRRDGEVLRDEGFGRDRIADLGLKAGDRVGFFKVRWRSGLHILDGPDLWMRSSDLTVTSDTVLDFYFETLRSAPQRSRVTRPGTPAADAP